jgi:LexA-binding, inner membrane-associated putative hydrolase
MLIGHFAVGLGSKRFAPRVPLTLLLVAALLSDVLGPVFSLLGWEHARIAPGNTRFIPLDLYDYPWSHSLLMTIAWATLLALIYHFWRSDPIGSLAIWLGAASHWVLDWITHRPDMPLYPGARGRYGLGLWNSIPGTMVVEIAMLGIGVWLYIRVTRPRDWIGKYILLAFVFTLLLLYVEVPFSSPPQSIRQLDFVSIVSTVVLLAWASWFDAHRGTAH